jgi:peptidoglycan-associated lipoprotein
MRRKLFLLTAGVLVAAACGGSQPEPETPAPAPIDSTAIKEQMRRDSIAAAERARAEAERRAAEERARAEAARITAMLTAELQERVQFDFDQSDIRMEFEANLNRKAAILMANAALRLRIEGHADERGSDEYNLALGNRRAESAKRYLVNAGVPDNRIEIVSFGEERPLDPASTEEAWAQNRRDEFRITAGGAQLTAPN